MTKRLLALVTALFLLLSMAPPALAATDGPCITASTVSAYQGNGVRVYLTAQQFSSVGSVDFTLYYDADAMTVSSTSTGGMIDGSTSFLSVNTDIAGQVTVSAVTMNSFSDSGTLLSVYFNVNMDAQAKDYPLNLTVGNAYGVDLQPMAISSVSGKLTVNSREPEKRQFYLGSYIPYGDYYLQTGESVTMRLVNNNYYSDYNMASGDFTVKYDPQLLQLDSVELMDALKKEDAVWSINTSIAGTILISYASASNVYSYELFDITFTVIGNEERSYYIQHSASNVYDEALYAYAPHDSSMYIYLEKTEEAVDYPDLWLETPRLVVGQQATSVLMLQEGAGVAAGDFVITYDPTLLRCVSVSVAPGLSAAGGVVMVDDNFTDGTIEFPYINTNGYDEEDIPLVEIVWEPLRSDAGHTIAIPSGSMIYDVNFQPTNLEFVTETGCVFVRTVIDPVCLEVGRTNYTCACGNSIDEDIVPELGHDISYTAAKDPTCTEIGWYDYESCGRCDYTTRVEIPELGHDEVIHEQQVQTCLGIGWAEYVTCTRCDYTTYEELPALGHRTIISTAVLTDPLSLEFTGNTPFTFENGAYYSNNHMDSTTSEFYIRALHDCQLTIVGNVSSESGCDRLMVIYNGTTYLDISGEITGQTRSFSLHTGDTITVRYRKDGSVLHGEDRGWVELQYDFVMVGEDKDAPSETLEPDCVNAVVCSYCDTVVKKALGHDEVPHKGQAPTCLDYGWNEYVTCNRCDYTTYEQILALGHDEVIHEEQVQTCLGIGWAEYVTCTRCDYTTYEELPALGHRTIISTPVLTDPLSLEFAGDTPFTFEEGAYYSNNHNNNSATEFYIRALYECQLTIIGNVSSENGCDRLIILYNGDIQMDISGENTGNMLRFALQPGDVITVRYQKDVSVHSGIDRGWVQLQYDFVTVGGYADAPSETLEPDCVNAVVCSYCDTVVKKALGHDEISHAGQAPTCLEGGWKEYVTCSRCDYNTYEALSSLGHDEIFHQAQEVTCTEIGWNEYVTCSRCDYTTYEQISALCHHTLMPGIVLADPISVETYPGENTFELMDGVYYSTNHADYSSAEMRIDVLYDCRLQFITGVSSEASYDKLLIVYNNQCIYESSGTVSGDEVTMDLKAGEFVTIHYQKDGSASYGDDRGWVQLYFDQVNVSGMVEVPSEEVEPDCLHAVICNTCGATVKEKLPHSYAAEFYWSEDHNSCEAIVTCSRDCGTQAMVNCGMEEDLSDPAITVHTAIAEYDGFTITNVMTCENYLVCFVNSDSTIISEAYYHYGDMVVVPDEPQKPASVPENYVFGGWDKEVMMVTGHAIYVAVYELPYPRGDMNCDFQVTDDDALYLLRHTLFPSRYPLQ